MPLFWLCYRHDHQISVVIEPGLPIIFAAFLAPPHVAAAVIPPSAMSTKTSSGVPRVIILTTLVVVLATSVEVVPHFGVGRCDGHHKMVGLYWAR
jgi:hypothetical protein